VSAIDPFVELRGEILREHIDVIDAVAQATPGASRMSVLRQIIAEWVERETHRATLVCRVAQGNGTTPESDRRPNGNAPARGRR
jgi:hypothetical protein